MPLVGRACGRLHAQFERRDILSQLRNHFRAEQRSPVFQVISLAALRAAKTATYNGTTFRPRNATKLQKDRDTLGETTQKAYVIKADPCLSRKAEKKFTTYASCEMGRCRR